MKTLIVWILSVMIGVAAPVVDARRENSASDIARVEREIRKTERELGRMTRQSLTFPEERQTYLEAAKTAWSYAERNYSPQTGLFYATSSYPFTTMWDVASGLAVLYAGHELNFMESAEYERRVRRALRTLGTVDLFDSAAFNKVYSASTGLMVDRGQNSSKRGYGWSVVDIGRLLIWLKILSVRHPQFGSDAQQVVDRLDMERLVRHGYLWGEDLDSGGKPRLYQEGQLGYEQYAARGFALWGFEATKALRLRENALPIEVMGKPLMTDLRGAEHLTSDPLMLAGLELGWDKETEHLAVQLLAVQKERHRRTGRVTLVGEDAVSVPPHFFYYYCVYTHNRSFATVVFNAHSLSDGPRWVSAKAAYAWDALLPSGYTALALRTVAPARRVNGWSSGVYEGSGASTGTLNINTTAVILEAVLVHSRGEPLLDAPPVQAERR